MKRAPVKFDRKRIRREQSRNGTSKRAFLNSCV